MSEATDSLAVVSAVWFAASCIIKTSNFIFKIKLKLNLKVIKLITYKFSLIHHKFKFFPFRILYFVA